MKAPRILWPTDFASSDLDALAAAGDIARVWHGEIIALHVIGDVAEEVYEERSTEGKDQAAWGLWRLGKEKAEKRLEDAAKRILRGVGYRCLSAFGDPATRITETIAELGVSLVVMAARRDKTLLQEMLLGSVAYKVVRTAPCNVLLVK